MPKVKQAKLPMRGYTLRDSHPRAHLYQTMGLLEKREDECLAALEEAEETPARLVRHKGGTWGWEGEEERIAAEEALEKITADAQSFYAMVIGPIYRGWWL